MEIAKTRENVTRGEISWRITFMYPRMDLKKQPEDPMNGIKDLQIYMHHTIYTIPESCMQQCLIEKFETMESSGVDELFIDFIYTGLTHDWVVLIEDAIRNGTFLTDRKVHAYKTLSLIVKKISK